MAFLNWKRKTVGRSNALTSSNHSPFTDVRSCDGPVSDEGVDPLVRVQSN